MGLRELVLSASLAFSLVASPLSARSGDRVDVGSRHFFEGSGHNSSYSIGNNTIFWWETQSGKWLFGTPLSTSRHTSRMQPIRNPNGGFYPMVVSDRILVKTNSGPMWFNGLNGEVTPASRQSSTVRRGRVVRERYGPSSNNSSSTHNSSTYVNHNHTNITHVVQQPTRSVSQPTPVARYIAPTTKIKRKSIDDDLVASSYRDARLARADGDYNRALTLLIRSINLQEDNVDPMFYDRLDKWSKESSNLDFNLQKRIVSALNSANSSSVLVHSKPYESLPYDFHHLSIIDSNDTLVYETNSGSFSTRLNPGKYHVKIRFSDNLGPVLGDGYLSIKKNSNELFLFMAVPPRDKDNSSWIGFNKRK